jgi:formylglycine-generating enzyme required for sulfatase activity
MDDPALQSGICLGIGSTADEQVTEEAKQTWYPLLAEWYQHAPDKGVHSAASWALRHCQLKLPAIDASQQPAAGNDWHVNSIGMTMLKIPAGSFIRQDLRHYTDPLIKGEPQKVTLTRPFLLSDREVSVALYQQFLDDPNWPRLEKPKEAWHPHAEMHRTPGQPVSQVNWNDAAFFCNWLSHKEGRTPCYRQTGNQWQVPSQPDGKFDEWLLDTSADGYRLPTEAEWEYACRAGTITDYSFGNETRFANQYVVFAANLTENCGSKLPNGWGLFDMHGNVTEWCQDFMEKHYGGYKEVTDPRGPATEHLLERVLRGGWFTFGTRNIMSGTRDQVAMSVSGLMYGFRIARTVSP